MKKYSYVLICLGVVVILFGLFSPTFVMKSCMGSDDPVWSKWGTASEVFKENSTFSVAECEAMEARFTLNGWSFDPLPPIRVYPVEIITLGGLMIIVGAIMNFWKKNKVSDNIISNT